MNTIWKNKIDNKYDIMVISEGDGYSGRLIIQKDNVELYNEPTSISYGARFGPDFSDVEEWKNKCLTFVDKFVE